MKTQLSLLLFSIQSELLTLISICFAFFLPISGILLMIGVLIAIDTFTGIWKAKKLKEKITSRKLSGIISKLALYEVTVIMFFLIDNFILNDIILTFL
jgi:phage-related holin